MERGKCKIYSARVQKERKKQGKEIRRNEWLATKQMAPRAGNKGKKDAEDFFYPYGPSRGCS